MTCLWIKSHTFGTKDEAARAVLDWDLRVTSGDSPRTWRTRPRSERVRAELDAGEDG